MEAKAHVDALERRLPTVSFALPAGAPAGTSAVMDGTPLPPDRLGMEQSVDPGQHTVLVLAPGRERWTTRVTVPERARGTVLRLELGAAVASPASEGAAPAAPPPGAAAPAPPVVVAPPPIVAAPAPPTPGAAAPAPCGTRLQRLLRGADQRACACWASSPGREALAPQLAAPRATRRNGLETHACALCPLAPYATHHASMALGALRRQNPRQEPGAVVPHAGICAGGGPSSTSRIGSMKVAPRVMSEGHRYRNRANQAA